MALSSTQFSISEGDLGSLSELSVCVHLTNVQDGLKRDVVILLDTVADTAGIALICSTARARDIPCTYNPQCQVKHNRQQQISK